MTTKLDISVDTVYSVYSVITIVYTSVNELLPIVRYRDNI